MSEKVMDGIRRRDEECGAEIPSHWQAQVDRRYLLTMLDKINTIQQEWWGGDLENNVAMSEIRCVLGGN